MSAEQQLEICQGCGRRMKAQEGRQIRGFLLCENCTRQTAPPDGGITKATEDRLTHTDKSGRSAWFIGAFMVVLGLFDMWYFSARFNVGVGNVANLDLMNQRTNGIILGVGLLVAGVVIIGIGFFLRSRRHD